MHQSNDPLELLTCPYDPVHRVAAKRFPYHLQKCRKQYSSQGWANCPFNARHEVPIEELDYHVSTCPDKDAIRQDYEEILNRPMVDEKRKCQPQPTPTVQPDDTEDWESEAFSQPFSIIGHKPTEKEVDAYDIVQAMQEVQVQAHVGPSKSRVIPGLASVQETNHKRSQKRQQNGEAGSYAEYPGMTDDERLAAIVKQYSVLNNRTAGSFVDFVSILNQYCQKSRINVPKYGEAPGVLGGFGAQVFVKGEIFTSMKYCGTKKEARHDAAKVALLGLNIPVVDPTPNKPMSARTATDHRRLRETHELQLLKQAGQPVQPMGRGQGQRQPVAKPPAASSLSATGPPMSQQPSHNGVSETTYNMPEATNGETRQSENNDEWTTVGRKGVKNPVYQHSLKMAGRGRGMIRK